MTKALCHVFLDFLPIGGDVYEISDMENVVSGKAGEPPNNIVQERELRISCLQPPLGVSTSGPRVVVHDTSFAINAEVMDSGREQEPTSWQWVCMAASGAPCFEGYDVPDTNANTLNIEPGKMLLPGDYIIKVTNGLPPPPA